jgi:phenylacetate-coenzyme A ligase PaaK-like adenylate-forming protein
MEIMAWLRALNYHRRNTRRSREQLEAHHRERFAQFVLFVQKRSPFYRDIIAERRIDPAHCSPADFPVLTKQDIVQHFDRIVTDPRVTRSRIEEFLECSTDPTELFDKRFHVLHTSGTSGTVGYFVFSHAAWIQGSSQVVRLMPLSLRRKRIAYVAATRGHFAGVSLMLTGNHGTNSIFFDVRSYDVNMPLNRLVELLNEFQPHVLGGYAAILSVLAAAQEDGRLQVRPRWLSNGGEPLAPSTREYVARTFQAPVANIYASSEHLFMGFQFPNDGSMVLLEDDLIFELEPDHTCVTNLFNYTTPLIRYRMDDILVPEENGNPAHPFRRVKEVIGRNEDGPIFANRHGQDDFIHPIVIVELIVRGLRSWQIVCLNKTSFRFLAQFDREMTAAAKCDVRARVEEKLRSILAEKEMDNVSFDIQEVDSIPVDPHSGKFRLIVNSTIPTVKVPGVQLDPNSCFV